MSLKRNNLQIKKILIVIGTRPNFIKITQFRNELKKHPNLDLKIVHTGQHFDNKMATIFFNQFNLTPDYFLHINQNSPNSQIAEIMIKLEDLINTTFRPDLIIVVGDVNSTLAGAITANKMNIQLAHLESGLRSFDNSMPEEHNRILTDKLSQIFFITEHSGYNNLKQEGINDEQILFSGNTMIDTLVAFKHQIELSPILSELNVMTKQYVLMTMHRPATVDDEIGLKKLKTLVKYITDKHKIVFPIHPRTLKKLDEFGLKNEFINNKQLILVDPLDYFAFQKLIQHSKFILTDSGGIQEESTFIGIPCLTLRPNTERPITVTEGTNTLVPFDINVITQKISEIESGSYKKGKIPKYWDGKSTQRIVEFISKHI